MLKGVDLDELLAEVLAQCADAGPGEGTGAGHRGVNAAPARRDELESNRAS